MFLKIFITNLLFVANRLWHFSPLICGTFTFWHLLWHLYFLCHLYFVALFVANRLWHFSPLFLWHLYFMALLVANRCGTSHLYFLWHLYFMALFVAFVALLTFTFCGKPFANRAALKSALPPTEATNIGLWTPQILLQPLYKLSHLFRIILCKYIHFQPNFLFDL